MTLVCCKVRLFYKWMEESEILEEWEILVIISDIFVSPNRHELLKEFTLKCEEHVFINKESGSECHTSLLKLNFQLFPFFISCYYFRRNSVLLLHSVQFYPWRCVVYLTNNLLLGYRTDLVYKTNISYPNFGNCYIDFSPLTLIIACNYLYWLHSIMQAS